MTTPGSILVFNVGSASIRAAVFDASLTETLSATALGISTPGQGRLRCGHLCAVRDLPDHEVALEAVLEVLADQGVRLSDLMAAGHRVVHGGASLTGPARVNANILAQIRACIPLAPLHNPHNLAGIKALARLVPGLPQYVSFDTAFHATNPEVARSYALPPEYAERGLRRYGFHGLSYAALCANLPELSGAPLPRRLLACHLGNGASLCAILDGQSVATTMGYSPLEGLTMGTRAGSMDPNAVLALVDELGSEGASRLLNFGSGLRGMSGGMSDMRQLLADPSPQARFAVDHFVYWVQRHAGSMIAAMQGVDAIALTGGIGEHAAVVRGRILKGLGWTGLQLGGNLPALHSVTSAVQAWVVPAQEERQIAADTFGLVQGV
ncbi:acetate/propionate family kinase [Puniceibacterium sp. IMCC21224]|uniref:acetate/propionate family kinase n=1 Tax=Puniceibacterium sp. IMCC21224 TaxID=1618204 RepID=UPI00064D8477|nr:acetate kinase [Puniceibacterium sp. IMCC21224]KMK65661.1 acetate kinase [Puniceibacterium sp. IMCC21224]